MDDLTKKNLKAWLRGMLRRKIDNYSKETDYMPFFKAIFTEEQRATASVIQSFYTSFGMSVYEQMSRIMAQGAGFHAETQYDLLVPHRPDGHASGLASPVSNGTLCGSGEKVVDCAV